MNFMQAAFDLLINIGTSFDDLVHQRDDALLIGNVTEIVKTRPSQVEINKNGFSAMVGATVCKIG